MPENRENKNQEENFVPLEESLQMAKDLLERHEQELRDTYSPPSLIQSELLTEEDKKGIAFGKSAIKYFIRKIPEEQATRFVGHGIARGDLKDNLAIFINILDNKTIKGDYAKLVGSGYYDADSSGDFLIVSHADKPLAVLDEEKKPKLNEMGWLADVGAYVVNAKLYPIVEDLRIMFPDANIVKANELSGYIDKETEKTE